MYWGRRCACARCKSQRRRPLRPPKTKERHPQLRKNEQKKQGSPAHPPAPPGRAAGPRQGRTGPRPRAAPPARGQGGSKLVGRPANGSAWRLPVAQPAKRSSCRQQAGGARARLVRRQGGAGCRPRLRVDVCGQQLRLHAQLLQQQGQRAHDVAGAAAHLEAAAGPAREGGAGGLGGEGGGRAQQRRGFGAQRAAVASFQAGGAYTAGRMRMHSCTALQKQAAPAAAAPQTASAHRRGGCWRQASACAASASTRAKLSCSGGG